MRFRAQSFAFLALPVCLFTVVACSDDPPIYPPIVINIIGSGAVGIGASSSAGATTSVGDQSSGGGDSTTAGGSNAGNSSTGGSSPAVPAHCAAFNSGQPPAPKTQCDLDKLADGGELKGDVSADQTLKSGKVYTLNGEVRVMPGKTLTIEPCVKIVGKDEKAVLVVMSSALGDTGAGCTYHAGKKPTPAGKLVAVGEPMAPIIFTSAKPVGQRKPGDWGGVLLLGNARNDQARDGVQVPTEGLLALECYGYHTDEFNTESSGHLEYVRIEYASQRVNADQETNGLTLAALGSGTEIHYVEVSNSADDCFEWFGGVVNADHLIATNCDDDMFDIDTGYSGHLQYLFGREDIKSTEVNSFAFEVTQGPGAGMLPAGVLTKAQISNTTQCGSGKNVLATNERGGGYFFGVPSVHVMNTFMTGFTSKGRAYGLNTDNGFGLDATRIFNQLDPLDTQAAKSSFMTGMGNSLMAPDQFCDCWSNPPAPVAATVIAGVKPSGFPDESPAYVGAFADATADANWMKGLWVDWSSK